MRTSRSTFIRFATSGKFPQIEESIHADKICTDSAANIIGATQADEDFERESFASQLSCTTTRIRLQEKYVKVATLYKDECSPEEIKEHISKIALNAMVKSAIYEDLHRTVPCSALSETSI
jgi:hypothetical protein